MTTTFATYETLLSDWQVETAAHADSIRKSTELALRYGVGDGPQIADWIALPGVEVESDESGAPIYSRDRVQHGPWVRVYDATANGGDGGYAWAKGSVLIPDHAVESVRMAGDPWDKLAAEAAAWPVKPCDESLVIHPSSDADDAETDADRAQANWCPSCEHDAPLIRVPAESGGGWIRVAHRRNGERIDL